MLVNSMMNQKLKKILITGSAASLSTASTVMAVHTILTKPTRLETQEMINKTNESIFNEALLKGGENEQWKKEQEKGRESLNGEVILLKAKLSKDAASIEALETENASLKKQVEQLTSQTNQMMGVMVQMKNQQQKDKEELRNELLEGFELKSKIETQD